MRAERGAGDHPNGNSPGRSKEACEAQKEGVTTFIEVILNQELGEPFRRDAMTAPG